ncbi:MAG: hypothetical protein ABWK01_06100 [Infirmifilum sp.]
MGLRHRRLAIKVYTVASLIWFLIVIVAMISLVVERLSVEGVIAGLFAVLLIGMPPLFLLAVFMRREAKELALVSPDPYLASAKEKISAMRRYFRARPRSRGADHIHGARRFASSPAKAPHRRQGR